MKISELLKGVNVLEWKIDKDTEVKDIKIDSNQVSEGDLFVWKEGGQTRFRRFAQKDGGRVYHRAQSGRTLRNGGKCEGSL